MRHTPARWVVTGGPFRDAMVHGVWVRVVASLLGYTEGASGVLCYIPCRVGGQVGRLCDCKLRCMSVMHGVWLRVVAWLLSLLRGLAGYYQQYG